MKEVLDGTNNFSLSNHPMVVLVFDPGFGFWECVPVS